MTDYKETIKKRLKVDKDFSLALVAEDIENGNIQISFDKENSLHSIIIGEDLDYQGYIIAKDGAIINETKFSFETMLPPTSEFYLKAFLNMHKYENSIEKALRFMEH